MLFAVGLHPVVVGEAVHVEPLGVMHPLTRQLGIDDADVNRGLRGRGAGDFGGGEAQCIFPGRQAPGILDAYPA